MPWIINRDVNRGNAVRFRQIKQENIGGVTQAILELETTLNGDITAAVTSLTLTDASAFPSSGYIYVQTKPTAGSTTETVFSQSEVIKYTGKSTHTLTGLTRGSSAPTYGLTPQASTVTAHSDLDNLNNKILVGLLSLFLN